MNAKTVFSSALVWTALSLGAVRGQTPGISPLDLPPGPPPTATGNGELLPGPGATPLTGRYQVSSWIRGDKYACCGEVGGDGPIETELFFRIGPSIVAGNGTIADVLQTGLYLGGGGRVLFFDPAQEAAWTVELGIANISNHAHFNSNRIPLTGEPTAIPLEIIVPQNPANPATPPDVTGNLPPQRVFFGKGGIPGVTLRQFNRTFLDLGGGKEWYLMGAANSTGTMVRAGFDAGGRWGSAMAEFNEIRHRTDVIGGVWTAAHADVEIPCGGCCVFQAGLRVEYGYTWSDILQIQNKSDVQDISILFNIGLRF